VQAQREGGVDRVPATVQAVRRATVSTRIPARVSRVLVAAGDAIRAGQVLVSLADDDVQAQVNGARAAFATAEAHERRVTWLNAQGVTARSDLESAQAARAQAEAGLRAAEESLRYTQLRAPFDGRVQAKRVNEGDLVMPGTPLVDVEGRELELIASLSAGEVARFARGQSMDFEAGEVKGRAEVTTVAPSADPLAHRVEIRARVLDAPASLRAGAFARLLLPRTRESAGTDIWIPASALVQRGDLRGVFVAAGGRAELRWLLTGDTVDGAVPVRAGLRPGEAVVDKPGDLLDGQRIEVTGGR
jgi:RND family efflux transporter MFP subunit